ncbi:MAG: calcium-binding protein, partial [Betaproteobacteria bacterium]|nr:calcium-binding protein [Betaproteobacteria bacterium]
GGAGADTLSGLGGNDVLIGGAGADTLIGGAGNDTFIVDNVGGVVIEAAGEGTDRVQTNLASYTLGDNVENLTFTGGGSHSGTGNALNNVMQGSTGADTLSGLAGNDVLSGGAGADTLIGGTGNDTYVVDNAGDVVTELPGEGIDTVQTTLAAYTLGANVENLTFIGGGAHTGIGNALSNRIQGGAGADTLDGAAGNDVLIGGLGNDRFVFSSTGFGSDTVQGFDANPAGGQDLLDISGLGISAASFAASVTISDIGASTLIQIGGDSILLLGIGDANTISAGDFLLAA